MVHYGNCSQRRLLWTVLVGQGKEGTTRRFNVCGVLNKTQRYIYPLVAPPTPDRLEQDKKSIDEQFEKTFTLVEQLAKDTEALKAAEQERTERLDAALGELETVLHDLKSANRRRDDEAQRMRDDVQGLKDSIPRALNNQKDLTDTRLREVNAELKSLKTLITQRMNPTATSTSVSNFLRPSTTTGSLGPEATGVNGVAKPATVEDEQPKRPEPRDFGTSAGRASPFASSSSGPSKASIPAWQLAMSKNAGGSASSTAGTVTDTDSTAAPDTPGSA